MLYGCPMCGAGFEADTDGSVRHVSCTRCGHGFNPASSQRLPNSAISPAPGEVLGKYRLAGVLGEGGMGTLYRATQTPLDRAVALKVLAPRRSEDPGFVNRFRREGKALAKLNHPNIVSVYDAGSEGPWLYIAMELVEGENLRQLLLRRGPMELEPALRLALQICEGLEYLHAHKVIHRDIKPENLLVDPQGRVKIADFGIARILREKEEAGGESSTRNDEVLGTPIYAAPEQLETPKGVDDRVDLYALGVVLVDLLTGDATEIGFDVARDRVGRDPRIAPLLRGLLKRDPVDRIPSAYEVHRQIERTLQSMAGVRGTVRRALASARKGATGLPALAAGRSLAATAFAVARAALPIVVACALLPLYARDPSAEKGWWRDHGATAFLVAGLIAWSGVWTLARRLPRPIAAAVDLLALAMLATEWTQLRVRAGGAIEVLLLAIAYPILVLLLLPVARRFAPAAAPAPSTTGAGATSPPPPPGCPTGGA